METSGGQVALAAIVVMLGVFAFTTDSVWIQIGAGIGILLALAAVFRGARHE